MSQAPCIHVPLSRVSPDRTIREALGYGPESKLPVKPKVTKEAILEAEMVAFDVQEDRIDGRKLDL